MTIPTNRRERENEKRRKASERRRRNREKSKRHYEKNKRRINMKRAEKAGRQKKMSDRVFASLASEKLIGSYADLVDALREARMAQKKPQIEIDDIAGLPSGYTAKIEMKPGARNHRRLGDTTLPRLLQALGVRLVLVKSEALPSEAPSTDDSANGVGGRLASASARSTTREGGTKETLTRRSATVKDRAFKS